MKLMEKEEFSVLLLSTSKAPFGYGLRVLVSMLKEKGIHADLLFTRSEARRKKRQRAVRERGLDELFLEFIRPYQLIGISVYSDNINECRRICRLIKNKFPDKKIIAGAFHATVCPNECLEFCDYVCVGEGFLSFINFTLQQKENFKKDRDNSSLPQGIWGRKESVESPRNGCGKVIENLDLLPFPSFDPSSMYVVNDKNHIVNMEKKEYLKYLGGFYFTMMSFGCPFSCAYCGNSALRMINPDYTRLRWHSADYIFNEINNARKINDFNIIWFIDDAFIAMDDKLFDDFVLGYPEKVGLPFYIPGIIPRFTARFKERIGRLADIGMVRAKIGIQTGSKRLLEFYKRQQTNDEVIQVNRELSERKIPAICDVIIDSIGEKPQDTFETIELLSRLKPPILVNLFSLRVFPGTELAKIKGALKEASSDIDSYRAYRPTLGNLIIASMNFIRFPRQFIAWLGKHNHLLHRMTPRVFMKLASLFIFIKYQTLYIRQRDYLFTPLALIKLDNRLRGRVKR